MEISGIPICSAFCSNDFDEHTQSLSQQYNIVGFIDGHISGNKMRNPIWVINEKYHLFLLMLCAGANGKDIFTKLCPKSYKQILEFEINQNKNKKITWNISNIGYVCGSTLQFNILYIHQVIMDYYRNGKGTSGTSVDHIDRNPYNNTLSNLRLATCKEQNNNQKGVIPGTKRERQYNARELPENIKQEDMPKYITYNVNVWNKEKNKSREFFRIETHPLLFPKVWESVKSMNISIHEKLEQAKKVLQDLDNGILPKYQERNLPKHVYFSMLYNNPYLVYDNRNTSCTKKMKIKDNLFDINNVEKRNKQVYMLNHLIIQLFGENESILSEDYQYYGEEINEEELNELLFQLPKYISLYNERGVTTSSFHRIVNDIHLNKKMKLPNNHTDIEKSSVELIEEINSILPKLNTEIIKKYGKEYAIIDISNEIVEQIMEEKINGFPTNVRIQTFVGEEYLVFNKIVNKRRLNTTLKLPNNYHKNNQLHEFNTKIINLYGQEHAFDLSDYPYEEINNINIPEKMYVVLNCKLPYLFIVNDKTTITHILPQKYDLQTEINTFYENRDSYICSNKNTSYEDYKTMDGWKPKNISLMNKDKRPILLYQKRIGDDCRHYISILLPTVYFDMNLYLCEMIKRITEKYGKQHNIITHNE